MYRILFLLNLIILPSILIAQCGPRYQDDVFTTVTETEDILYGNNISFSGSSEDLFFDFYEPLGDTLSARPLIILAHGGFFLNGSRDDTDIDDLCRAYAAKGYACASISYRLGWSGFIPDSIQLGEALIRGVQDAKAAVRFFRQDAATTNTYRIDPDNIFVGGSSAGGFIGVQYAFLNDLTALPLWAQSLITGLGGIEGNSGNAGWPSEIQAGISYAGAVVDTTWMTGTTPIVSTHSVGDGTVPYGAGSVVFLFFSIYDVMGSSLVHEKADRLGAPNSFLPFSGSVHVPHVGSTANFDATVDHTVDFLYDIICNPIPICAVPGNPVTSIISSFSATLSWDPVAGAIGYQVNGGPVGGSSGSFNTGATSRTLNILNPATAYSWKVRAYCPPDLSDWSADENFATPSPRLNGEQVNTTLLLNPNPTNSNGVKIAWENAAANTLVRLIDIQGKVVFDYNVNNGEEESGYIWADHLNPGIYVVVLKSDFDIQSKKLHVLED